MEHRVKCMRCKSYQAESKMFSINFDHWGKPKWVCDLCIWKVYRMPKINKQPVEIDDRLRRMLWDRHFVIEED